MYQAAQFGGRRPELFEASASEVLFLVFVSGFGSSSQLAEALRVIS